jgi:glycerol-3-phosphate dehydrogenase
VHEVFDVAVIGAGLVGSAIARELAGTASSVALLEAREDVGDGTSKANTAILHTGFDAKPGTLESRLVARGYHLLGGYAQATGIPVERTGAVLVAWTGHELATLPALREKAERNGYHETKPIDADEVYRLLPALAPGALGGLIVPGESITCTWTANLALATDAVRRGATLLLRHAVTGVHGHGHVHGDGDGDGDGWTTLRTTGGDVRARWVVNAAGLGGDGIDRMFGHDRFTVTPRRGELLVYDKQARPLAPMIVLPVPSAAGKGVLISPTVYGNVMLGPTAQDLDDRTATATSTTGIDFLLGKGGALMPALLAEEVTASYAGLRASIGRDDYRIEADVARRYLLVGGIRSTGLTASMAIAEHVSGLLADAVVTASVDGDAAALLDLTPRTGLPAPPRMPNLGEAFPRPYADPRLIARDPEYGRIVCFCERVTAGEIRDAYAATIPPRTLGGLRRRTRAMNGRCQGFFCGARLRQLAGRADRNASPAGPVAGEAVR